MTDPDTRPADPAVRAGEVLFTTLDAVASEPIGNYTTAQDQGTTRVLISNRVNGSPDLFVSVFSMGPGEVHPPHLHPNVGEMYYVLAGSATIRVGDETRHCTADTAIYTPRGVAHGITTADDESCSVMIVFPTGDWNDVEKVWA